MLYYKCLSKYLNKIAFSISAFLVITLILVLFSSDSVLSAGSRSYSASSEKGKTRGEDSNPYLPTKDASSEFMIGNISVGIFFIESNATNPPGENAEDWNSTELQLARNEILDGFHWWEMRAAENHTTINFSWEFHEKVNVSSEPIKHKSSTSQTGKDMWKWVDEATDSLGFEASGYQGVRDYINDLRIRKASHWTFAVFVVDSSNDKDNEFSDGDFAFAYLGGPFCVMTYGNQNYGIENMDAVMAHEMGHIFFALDEYAEAEEPKTKRTGYLNVPNKNSEYGGPAEEKSIMRGGTEPYTDGDVSRYARGAIGWWDRDGDAIVDIVDTHPETETEDAEDVYYSTEVFINGSALVQPLENKNPLPQTSGKNISLNTITGVEYNVDGGGWQLTRSGAVDGVFDEQIEEFSLRLFLSNGSHTVRVRAVNDVGNVDLTPTELDVKINLRLAPHIEILTPGANSTQTKVVNISWEVSDSDGTIQEINLYYAPSHNNSGAHELETIVEGLPGSNSFYLWETYSVFNLSDGFYTILVMAVDNSSMVGSNSTQIYLNNPDRPELLVLSPSDETEQGTLLFNWLFRDNDVELSLVNESFLFDVYLDVFGYGVEGNKSDHSILIYHELKPDDPLLGSSVEYINWSIYGVEDGFDFSSNNWSLNMSMNMNTQALAVVNDKELPDGFVYDEKNGTFKSPDASCSFRVVVTECSDEAFNTTESSTVFQLDNPDPPVLVLEVSGKLGYDDYFVVREQILFSAEDSYDPDENNTAFLYSWDFGDGTYMNESSEEKFRHWYARAGDYTVSVRVTDDTNRTTTMTISLQIHLEYPFVLVIDYINSQQEEQGWVWEDENVSLKTGLSDEDFASPDYLYSWYLYPQGALQEQENLLHSGNESEFSFALSEKGSYTVVLEGFDSANEYLLFGKANTSIEVRNKDPVAHAVDYVRVNPGETVLFNGSASVDTASDMAYLTYSWYLGNYTDEKSKLGAGKIFEYAFNGSGEFSIFLKVTDDDGNFSVANIRVKVNEYAIDPVIQVEKSTALEGEKLRFAGILFQVIPGVDFDEANFTKGLSFLWDFDDGAVGSGKQMDHAFSSSGSYKVTLHVQDNDSLDDPYHAELTIKVYELPLAYFAVTFPGENESLFVDDEITFDAEGSTGGGGAIVKYLWDFGDGTVEHYYDGDDITDNYGPKAGSLKDGKKITHSYTKKGIYTVKLTVYNEHGGSGSSEKSLLVKEKEDGSDSFISSITEDPSFANEDFRNLVAIVIVIVVVLFLSRRGKRRKKS